jgi:hypothetical protein
MKIPALNSWDLNTGGKYRTKEKTSLLEEQAGANSGNQ